MSILKSLINLYHEHFLTEFQKKEKTNLIIDLFIIVQAICYFFLFFFISKAKQNENKKKILFNATQVRI